MRLKILSLVVLVLIAVSLFLNQELLWRASMPTAAAMIEDNARIFSADEIDYIHQYHAMLLEEHDLDYRIITLDGQDDINQFATETFNKRLVGDRSGNNRGLLLVIDVKNNLVRLEVSAGLESVYTDAFVAYIEKLQMVQFFRTGRVADGIFAASEIIRTRAIDARNGLAFQDSQYAGSAGGGATSPADINRGKETLYQTGQPDVMAAETPEESLRRYQRALENRNGRNDLDVFTPESRDYMAGLLSTPVQMDNAAKRLKGCEIERVTYNDDKTRAVVFHSLADRSCDPFPFQVGEDGKWRIDLKALGLGTNHTFGNIWYVHFDHQEESGFWEYFFGFRHINLYRVRGEDGRFDHQGIPYYHRYGIHFGHVGEDVLVTDVHPGSVMDEAGLKAGDRIVEWEGKTHLHTAYLNRRFKEVRPGLDIPFTLRRDGKLLHKMFKAPPQPKAGDYRFGFSYSGYAPKLAGKHVRLPVVYYVDPLGPGADSGLRPGDIIRKWQDIENPNEGNVKDAMKSLKAGEPLRIEVYRDEQLVVLESVAKPLREMSKVH